MVITKPFSNLNRITVLRSETGLNLNRLADLEMAHFGSNRHTRMKEKFRTKINPIGSFENMYDDYLIYLYNAQQFLNDGTANRNNLTNSGAVISTDTPFAGSSQSASFTRASSQYMSIIDASQTGLDLATTFTIEFWAKFTTIPSISSIVSKDDDAGNGTRGYFVYVTSSFLTVLVSNGSGASDIYHYAVVLPTGAWHHYAVTCNVANISSTTFEFFVDGASVGNGTSDVTDDIVAIKNNTVPFGIGARYNTGAAKDFGDYLLDEVRVWNTVRTATQINNNKSLELTGTETGLQAYYPFEAL